MTVHRQPSVLALGAIVAGCVAGIAAACVPPPPDLIAIGAGGAPGGDQAAGPGITRRLRRLSAREYNNVVRDLLGDDSRPADSFMTDAYQNGFDNGSAGLVVQEDQAAAFQEAAEMLAARAVTDLPRLLGGCDPSAADDGEAACLERFLASFPRRAFRRPLTDTEQARLRDVYAAGAATGDFSLGVQLVIETVLQSPQFLYREELGAPVADATLPPGTVRLTAHEVASELSFLLTGSAPDDPLLAAVDEGRFQGPEDYRREALRLLATPAAQATMRAFLHEWLGTDRLATVVKDPAIYAFDHPLASSMSSELDRDFDRLLWGGDGSLRELFTSAESFVDPGLAALYGVDAPASDFAPVSLDPAIRGGVLTRPGFLAVHADVDSSGPVARGVFVLGSLLCMPPPPPPPDVPPAPPVAEAVQQNQTTRQRFQNHLSSDRCNGCHNMIDGIGFGFEAFDGIGAYRTTENGAPVDDSGWVTGTTDIDGPFAGVTGLADRLLGGPELPACFVRQIYRYGMGQVESEAADRVLLAALSDGFSVERRLTDLLLALVADPAFVLRASAVTAAPPGGAP